MKYLQLKPEEAPPDVSGLKPFRSVVIVEAPVTSMWQNEISEWLVKSGCLYMMAWGEQASSWDDSVDWANLEEWDFSYVPDDRFVITTWHDNETLEEVFWFTKHLAEHSSVGIKNTLLVHISESSSEDDLIDLYNRA